jgi:hypothetical protein
MMIHTNNPSFMVGRRSEILGWPPAKSVRPYLKNKNRKDWGYGSTGRVQSSVCTQKKKEKQVITTINTHTQKKSGKKKKSRSKKGLT